jgi:hypothetical protein
MVLDVVTSRQRRYQNRVLLLVAHWEADNDEHSMRWLSTHEPAPERYGLRPDEPNTVATVARNMVAFADDLGVNEDQACKQWADEVAGLEHAPRLDPIAGAVPGIGPRFLLTCACAVAQMPSSQICASRKAYGNSASACRPVSTPS